MKKICEYFICFLFVLFIIVFLEVTGIKDGSIAIIKNMNIDLLSKIAAMISYLFAMLSIVFAYHTYKSYHEQKRREFSINILFDWTRLLTKEGTAARKLVEKIEDRKKIEKILDMESIEIERNDEIDQLLIAVLGHDRYESITNEQEAVDTIESDDSGHEAKLKKSKIVKLVKEDTIKIRWLVISYLNNLEIIFSAWNHNIADQKMVEEQFRDLIVEEKGYNLLKTFRSAAGGAKTYPNIERFSSEIIKQNEAKSGKTPL